MRFDEGSANQHLVKGLEGFYRGLYGSSSGSKGLIGVQKGTVRVNKASSCL